jgi:hypothetical protein
LLSDTYFSEGYSEARQRFRDAASAIGADIHAYPLDCSSDDSLTIDVALVGESGAPALVISSGVHGVEGFFGSAVQLALLERLGAARERSSVRYVLIHAVNPFGFSRLRRFNEDNVDLNRNFLAGPGDYQGAPDGYAALTGFLNPESPPSRLEPFRLKALWNIWRQGMPALKEAVAGGQYEYSRGLFFGGRGPCASNRIVRQNCESWLETSARAVHLDLHTGLGASGTYKLLLNESEESSRYPWYVETFGAESVEPHAAPGGTAYTASGLFGEWMQDHFNDRDYRSAVAEFGTCGVIRVLAAIRAENRAHHYAPEGSSVHRWAKGELLECFCPRDSAWRRQVVASSLGIIDQGRRALLGGR